MVVLEYNFQQQKIYIQICCQYIFFYEFCYLFEGSNKIALFITNFTPEFLKVSIMQCCFTQKFKLLRKFVVFKRKNAIFNTFKKKSFVNFLKVFFAFQATLCAQSVPRESLIAQNNLRLESLPSPC